MPINYKMGNGVRRFTAYMNWYGVERVGDEGFGGEGENLSVFLSGNT